MKVFFVTDEAAPLYKIGGLGDVGAALPKSLVTAGVDCSIILPKHPDIVLTGNWRCVYSGQTEYNHQPLSFTIHQGLLPNSTVPVYLIEENTFISQSTDASDNHADKFAVFCLGFCLWLSQFEPQDRPHIIHLNDWHTALIPLINRHRYSQNHYRYLLTIHNLMYQGATTTPVIAKLNLPETVLRHPNQPQLGSTNILLEGIIAADRITTVSPQYAQDIFTPEFGEGINSLILPQQPVTTGITNGIDTASYDPQRDPHIEPFSLINYAEGKVANQSRLSHLLGLEYRSNTKTIGFVGRLDPRQKGIDLIIEALRQHLLPPVNCQFILLGTGDPALESALHQAAKDQPQVSIITRFDEPLSRLIYAASDVILIPSKFEPCGLIQMIANRYGAIPVAHATGGLKDTIQDDHNGFLFSPHTTADMIESLNRALSALADPDTAQRLIETAMQTDFSWDNSARRYRELYQSLMS